MSFESAQNFTLLDKNVPEMPQMTLIFWINTLKAGKMTVISYGVSKNAYEFSLTVETEKMSLQVHSFNK